METKVSIESIKNMRGKELLNFIRIFSYNAFNPHAVNKLVAAVKAFNEKREEDAAQLTAVAYSIENYTSYYHSSINKKGGR